MSTLQPGIHPNFNMSSFPVAEQRVLRKMANFFHLTRNGELNLGTGDSKYRYALVKPTQSMKGYLHTEREVAVIFSDYENFQPRTIDAFDRLIEEFSEEFRVEKVVRILISGDREVASKIKQLFSGNPDAPIVIPYHYNEFSLSTPEEKIVERIRDFTFSRDLFSVSSPLKSDVYFFGRSNLINEIVAKLGSGENFGLFGLRRSGKTSLVSGVNRALKRRGVIGVVIDCQSPSIHQRRWNELLAHISSQVRKENALPAIKSIDIRYDTLNAPESFVEDMREARKRLKVDFLAILFDEVERISFGTASSTHWNNERDFLLFWQAMRAGFQSDSSPFTFLMVGTNPAVVEKAKVFESDNPLFGNVEKRFIPMFTPDQVNEMVDNLGAIMGVHFDQVSKMKLFEDFGGHPFLTRQACSFIANQTPNRPLQIDRTRYAAGFNSFSVDANTYVKSVVELLQAEYPDEHEMLKYLGHGDTNAFENLAAQDSTLVEHLKGYGLVTQGSSAFFFNVGVVERYFRDFDKPVALLGQADRRAEVSRKRNDLELELRQYVFKVATFSMAKSDRQAKLFSKLPQKRRDALAGMDFRELFEGGASPLYFDEVRNMVLWNWEDCSKSLGISKIDFEFHTNKINALRVDAHSKDIADTDLDQLRVSLKAISDALKNV